LKNASCVWIQNRIIAQRLQICVGERPFTAGLRCRRACGITNDIHVEHQPLQSIGLVTDVEPFLRELANSLRESRAHE
jgi:hypothetical protein